MKNTDLTIFSIFHKEYAVPNCDFIVPLQVGKDLATIDLGFLSDNTGTENISKKNPTFCELTGLYWIWKNLDKIESKYIGLAHYRRYFILPKENKSLFKKNKKYVDCYFEALNSESLLKVQTGLLKDTLLESLNKNYIIKPAEVKLYISKNNVTVKDFYIYNHIKEDWDILEAIIQSEYSEYLDAFNTISNGFTMSCYNMFIADKFFLNNYCAWLFSILTKLENSIKISAYPYQQRVFGFISERLLNVYILHEKRKVKTFPLIFFND